MYIYVIYKAKPGRRAEFLSRVKELHLPQQIRQEDGCLCYNYYLSHQDADEILLVESWETTEKQKIHMQQPHMKTLLAIKNDCILESRLGHLTVE